MVYGLRLGGSGTVSGFRVWGFGRFRCFGLWGCAGLGFELGVQGLGNWGLISEHN